MLQGNPQLLCPTTIITMTTQGKDIGSIGDLSCQPYSHVILLDIHSKQTKQKARHWAMDKVMKRLGNNLVEKMVQQSSLLYNAMSRENLLVVVGATGYHNYKGIQSN
jgi:hypothetical protein